jgi:YedE family putative selenium metabolism protein
MIGCLMFLGCPFRMLLRIAGGDLNAIAGLVGFAGGIGAGIFFLNRGYSLKRTYKMTTADASLMPAIAIAGLIMVAAAPAFIHFTKAGGGPGAKHAAFGISLIAGLLVGYLSQRTRFCMIAGIRDFILFKETKMLLGFVSVIIAAMLCNMALTATTGSVFFKLGFVGQPIAHTDGLWNALGLFLAGFACVLLGGCPMRQLILAGEGNTESSVTILGLIAGAAFAHNFGLASSDAGPTANGQIAVILGIVIVGIIAYLNTFKK